MSDEENFDDALDELFGGKLSPDNSLGSRKNTQSKDSSSAEANKGSVSVPLSIAQQNPYRQVSQEKMANIPLAEKAMRAKISLPETKQIKKSKSYQNLSSGLKDMEQSSQNTSTTNRDTNQNDNDGDLFGSYLGDLVSDSYSKPPLAFEDEHTEVIMDEAVKELPNTYFSDEKGRIFHVKRTPFIIGRSSECDLVVQVKGVSRKHAELTYGDGHFVIRDLDSLNGIKVNGTPLPQVRLNDADVIQFGRYKLSFFTDTNAKKPKHASQKSSADLTQTRLSQESVLQYQPQAEDEPKSIDWLVKLNFGLVALIILVTVGFIIWDNFAEEAGGDLAQTFPPQSELQTQEMGGIMTQTSNDWTMETQSADSENYADESSDSLIEQPNLEARSPQEVRAEQQRKKATEQRMRLEAERAAREEQLRAEEAEMASQRRQEEQVANIRSKALALIERIETAYITGENFAKDLYGIQELAESRRINSSLKRQLAEKYQLFSTLRDDYEEGLRSYEAGNRESAFRLWSKFISSERTLLNISETSRYAAAISDYAVESTFEKAQRAEKGGDIVQAMGLYQKLVSLRPAGEFQENIDGLMSKASRYFEQAENKMNSDPAEAARLFQLVMQIVPNAHPLAIRSEAKLVWLQEGVSNQ